MGNLGRRLLGPGSQQINSSEIKNAIATESEKVASRQIVSNIAARDAAAFRARAIYYIRKFYKELFATEGDVHANKNLQVQIR